MNKEIGDFRHSIVTMGESWSDYQIHLTQVCESAQATSQAMDNIQPQVTSICLDLEEQIDRAVHQMKTELRSEFQAALDGRAVSLETYMEMKVNSIRQDTQTAEGSGCGSP